MSNLMYKINEGEILDSSDYASDPAEIYTLLSEVVSSLLVVARKSFEKLEKVLLSTPAFI